MTTECFKTVGAPRLLKLADILDAAEPMQLTDGKPSGYYQRRWIWGKNDCGTPACALGHWAANNQDRWEAYDIDQIRLKGRYGPIGSAKQEFCLSDREVSELFGIDGCGNAQADPRKAAAYIRNFVFRNLTCSGAV